MPELDPGYAERHAARLQAYDDAMRLADHPDDAHLARAAIANCALCDGDGYRNGRICHHDERQDAINRRGIEACRAALSKLPKS